MSENSRCDARREQRFPCERMEYNKSVGWLLPTILGELFTELGFEVRVNHQQANGVDLEIFFGDSLVLVVEVLNWSIGSRLTNRRRGCIIRNLNEFECRRLLIHTIPLSNISSIREYGIDVLEIGYQVLPRIFYNFYQTRNQVIKREIDCDLTRREIKSKILGYVNNHLFAHKYLKFLMT